MTYPTHLLTQNNGKPPAVTFMTPGQIDAKTVSIKYDHSQKHTMLCL